MTATKRYKLGNMPFLVGMFDKPENPDGLPNTLPFTYWYDEEYGVLKQEYDKDIAHFLSLAYQKGSLLGTPMNQDGLGQEYLRDFLKFIENSVGSLSDKTVLEIGCGKGYLLKALQDRNSKAIGIEPGVVSKSNWDNLGVKVINDFFPSTQLTDKLDLIVTFCVLEHISNDVSFIKSMMEQLNDNGKIIIAVPNCEGQLERCDPSLFVHEHYAYHGMANLIYLLFKCGLIVTNESYSEYGGLLYVCAEIGVSTIGAKKPSFNIEIFAKKYDAFSQHIEKEVVRIQSENKALGIYCAARALAGLPLNKKYRFFDDDPHIHNLYYPPFDAKVENAYDLVDSPVDELWIFSYSFADIIEKKLRSFPELDGMRIVKLKQLTEID